MNKLALHIRDYSGWSDRFSFENPTDKQLDAAARKLKTYVNSTKFLRLGSTIDSYDLLTGKRKKIPVTDVMYTKLIDSKDGLPALDLRDRINTAILNRDPKMLQDVSLYNFFNAQKNKLLDARKLYLKLRRKRIIILSLVFGSGGAMLGILPIIAAKKNDLPIKDLVVQNSIKTGLYGAMGGLALTGAIEAFRKPYEKKS